MFTADQLICHLIGDYVLQTAWLANEKSRRNMATIVHCFFYILPFLLLKPSLVALAVMVVTHFFIDRFRLARFIVRWRDSLTDGLKAEDCQDNGFPKETPIWLAGWLAIIVDNVMHLFINGLSLYYL
jgi:hypothetical protein